MPFGHVITYYARLYGKEKYLITKYNPAKLLISKKDNNDGGIRDLVIYDGHEYSTTQFKKIVSYITVDWEFDTKSGSFTLE